MYSNSFLHAHFEKIGQQTILTHRASSAPLKIKKTFQYPDSDALTLYMMDASPGMMEADQYTIQLHLYAHSHAIVTNQASTKIHPAKGKGSILLQSITLEEQAILEYFPEPTILYQDSLFQSDCQVHIAPSATLFMADILTCGRVEREERFAYQSFSSNIQLYYDGKLIAYENSKFSPRQYRPERLGVYESFTHQATFWIVSTNITSMFEEELNQAINQNKPNSILAGYSRFEPYAIAVRLLGHTVWEIQAFIQAIWDTIRVSLLQQPPYQFRK